MDKESKRARGPQFKSGQAHIICKRFKYDFLFVIEVYKMVKKRVIKKTALNKVVEQDTGNRKLMAFIATFLSIIGFIIIVISKTQDKYVKHYAKQSLVVFIFALICFLVGQVALFIPIIGEIIELILNLLAIAAWLISWVYALMDKTLEVPVIGKYGRGLNI